MKRISLNILTLVMALFMSQGMMAQKEVLFEEHFDEKTLCSFTVEGSNGFKETNPVWKWDGGYGTVRADGFGKISETESYESYLVSPVIRLGAANTISFDYCNEFFVNVSEEVSVDIRVEGAAEWTRLDYTFTDTKDFVNTGDIAVPAEFEGKKVQFGFRYSSVGSKSSGCIAFDNVIVSGEKLPEIVTTVLFEEHFDEMNLCSFSVEGFNGKNEENPIWKWDGGFGTVRADAFGKIGAQEAYQSYLVSPVIKLGTANTISFDYTTEFFLNAGEDVSIDIRPEGAAEWTRLDYTFVNTKDVLNTGEIAVPAEFDGMNVQFGFRYSSIGSSTSGLMSVDNVVVKGAELPAEKKDPEISFPQSEYVYKIGSGDFNAPVVNNPHGVEVVYSSSNTDMADVDATNGFVMMYDLGSVVITATSVETDEYKSATASYTLIITDKDIPTAIEGVTAGEMEKGVIYDIQGRRVQKPGKGVFIVNGKKIVIK